MFVLTDPAATLSSRRVVDLECEAEVREINAPSRRDAALAINEMLLTWEGREITFLALRRRFSAFTLSAEGSVIESRRPPLVDIHDLGRGGVDRSGHAFPPHVFVSDAEYATSNQLAADGFVAWWDWPESTAHVLTHERAARKDWTLGEIRVANLRAVEVPIRGY